MFIKQRLVLCSQLERQFLHVNYQEYYLPSLRASELQVAIYIWKDYNKQRWNNNNINNVYWLEK